MKLINPAGLLSGETDAMVPPAASERMAAAYGEPTAVVVRHARCHVVPRLPQGSDAARAVAAFLEAANMRSNL